jgi:capsular exopolysaccharide synthesis family protein
MIGSEQPTWPNRPDGRVAQLTERGAGVRGIFAVLRRRGWIALACLILLPALVYLYSARLPKTYQAQVVVQPRPTTFTPSGPGTQALYQRLSPSSDFVEAWAQSGRVAALTATLRHPASGAARLGSREDSKTGWVTLTATGPNARESVSAANAFELALNDVLVSVARDARQQLITGTEQSLAIVRTEPLTAALRSLRAFQPPGRLIEVVVPAGGAAVVSPHPRRNAIMAVILALLVGAGLMALAEYVDRRLRRTEDLVTLAEAPLLGAIPEAAFRPGADPSGALEAFRKVRDVLTNSAGPFSSLVVVSPLKGEGRTTVAAGLAMAFAGAGRRVVLVDADMRGGGLTSRLGVPAGPGLGDFLTGTHSEPALQDVAWADGNLVLLRAGSGSADPAELLGSERMEALLEGFAAAGDLVVIDTPPLLAASDALPLLRRASAVLGVARLNETPRSAVRRMARMVVPVGDRFLGVIATGAGRNAWTAVEMPAQETVRPPDPSLVA